MVNFAMTRTDVFAKGVVQLFMEHVMRHGCPQDVVSDTRFAGRFWKAIIVHNSVCSVFFILKLMIILRELFALFNKLGVTLCLRESLAGQ